MDLSTAAGIEEISKRIRIAFNRITKGDGDIDDCVQEILCRMLEGKHKHSTIGQCVIDYLRIESGRKGDPGYTARINLKYANPIEPGRNEPKTGVDYGRELDSRRVSQFIEECGGGVSAKVLKMSFEGKTLKEIGDALGFSESRASQLLKGATEKMQFLVLLPENVRDWVGDHVL